MPRDPFYQFYDSTQTRNIRHLCSGYLFFTQSCSHLNQLHQHENIPVEHITDYFETRLLSSEALSFLMCSLYNFPKLLESTSIFISL